MREHCCVTCKNNNGSLSLADYFLISSGSLVQSLILFMNGLSVNQEPAATSNVSDQMTVIFCYHQNNSGAVLLIFTLHFHIFLLLIYS